MYAVFGFGEYCVMGFLCARLIWYGDYGTNIVGYYCCDLICYDVAICFINDAAIYYNVAMVYSNSTILMSMRSILSLLHFCIDVDAICFKSITFMLWVDDDVPLDILWQMHDAFYSCGNELMLTT